MARKKRIPVRKKMPDTVYPFISSEFKTTGEDTEYYIRMYFSINTQGFVPTNYAIGTNVVTA